MDWNRVRDIRGLELEETLAKNILCFFLGTEKESFVTGSERAGMFIGGEKRRWSDS